MSELPCVDCIILGICRSYGNKFNGTHHRLYNLSMKCSLLDDYIMRDCISSGVRRNAQYTELLRFWSKNK